MFYNKIVNLSANVLSLNETEMKKYVLETPNFEFGDFTITALMQPNFKQNANDYFLKLKKELENLKGIKDIKLDGLFVNIFLDPLYLLNDVDSIQKLDKSVMLEYPSPNSNKPLHLGHLKVITVGDALANLFSEKYTTIRTNLINDRGVHICKSMLGYKLFSKEKNPEDANLKSDHFVGKCYVLFSNAVKENPALEDDAQKMLQLWESNDKETMELWKKMNKWAFDGMKETYKLLGCKKFDKEYYESKFYKKGKKIILSAYKKGLVKIDADGNYVVDLSKYNTPNKVVLRKDLTSIYVTQDIYLAQQKFKDFNLDLSIYCVGSEQKEYFKQLFAIMQELNLVETKKLEHLAFGMISLPSGKMKSREGTVIDADDLVKDVENDASVIIKQKWPNIKEKELNKRKKAIALAAIKYFILSYDCRKDFVFNPEQSLSFEGNSGPYVLYTYARINSLLRKMKMKNIDLVLKNILTKEETDLARKLTKVNFKIDLAIERRSPHILIHYITDISNNFNTFYANTKIITDNKQDVEQRYLLLKKIKETYEKVLDLMNIPYLEKM